MTDTTRINQWRQERPEWRSDGRGDAVALGVEEVSDLHCVARLALIVILVHSRLEQERVFALGTAHFLYAVNDGRHKHARRAAHEVPHLLVDRDLGVLSKQNKTIRYDTIR